MLLLQGIAPVAAKNCHSLPLASDSATRLRVRTDRHWALTAGLSRESRETRCSIH